MMHSVEEVGGGVKCSHGCLYPHNKHGKEKHKSEYLQGAEGMKERGKAQGETLNVHFFMSF